MAGQSPMVEVCIFQVRSFLTQADKIKEVLDGSAALTLANINAIGLAMENIKKSAEVMRLLEVSKLAEAIGEVALYLRQHSEAQDGAESLTELLQQTVQFMRGVLNKLDWDGTPDDSSVELCQLAHEVLHQLKVASGEEKTPAAGKSLLTAKENRFYIESLKPAVSTPDHIFAVTIFFLHADGVEDIQAYSFLQYLQDKVREMHHLPEKILEDENAVDTIRNIGLRIWLTTDNKEDELRDFLEHMPSVERFDLNELDNLGQCDYWPDAEQSAITAAETGEIYFTADANNYVNNVLAQNQVTQAALPSGLGVQLLRLRETVNDLVLADALAAQNDFPQAALQVRKLITQLARRVQTLVPMALSTGEDVPDSLWIEGTSVSVGRLHFTFPNAFIHQPFRPAKDEVFPDPDGQVLFMRDGECYPLLSLAQIYQIDNAVTSPEDGIVMVLEGGSQPYGVLVDRLLDVQELEVKPVPDFVSKLMRTDAIIGCTFLQDGSISMVLDVAELSEMVY